MSGTSLPAIDKFAQSICSIQIGGLFVRPRGTAQSRTSKFAAKDHAFMCSNHANASLLVGCTVLAATGTAWHCNADSRRCGRLLRNRVFKLVAAHQCLTEHATSMTRLFRIVELDVAGVESSTSPCQRPPNLLLPAPCSCRLPAELAGWRLQHKGCQPHHGDGEPAPAWPRPAQDLHHWWGITVLIFCFEPACLELQRLEPTMIASDISLDIVVSA